MRGQRPGLVSALDADKVHGVGLCGEDAFDGVEGVRAEARGPLQGGQPVGPRIGGQQGEQLEALSFAVALAGQQAIQEARGAGAEFGEAFAQHGLGLPRFGVGPMPRQHGALSGHVPWE